MKNMQEEKTFVENVKAVLDADSDHLDARTLASLKRIRNAVLEKKKPGVFGYWLWFRISAATLAAASVIIIMTSLYFRSHPELTALNEIEDMNIISSGENLDFYAELEFYTWLAEERDNAG